MQYLWKPSVTPFLLLAFLPLAIACGDDGGGSSPDAGAADAAVSADAVPSCTEDDTRAGSTACGVNGRGLITQVCQSDLWVDGATCEDSDVCLDNGQQLSASVCGTGDVGFFYEDCTAGAWVTSATCSCGASVASQADYAISTVDELNALTGITQITGTLQINRSFPGTSLDALQELRCAGTLRVWSPSVTSLASLGNLAHVEAGVSIEGTGLANLNGLGGLRSVGDELQILVNSLLTSLDGLSQNITLGLGFRVNENPLLTTLAGFEGITEISGGSSIIDGNATLVSLNGLQNLATISSLDGNAGLLTIVNNGMLPDLQGLSGLTDLNGTLEITGNASLSSFQGLGLVSSPNGTLYLDSDATTDLDGLEELVDIGSLEIEGNGLQSLAGATKLKTVHGLLRIYGTTMTGSLAMPALESVGGTLELRVPALVTVAGFAALTSVGGDVRINDCASLTSLGGFSGLTSLGGIALVGCEKLTSLDGLGTGFTTFTGDVNLSNNLLLVDLGAISGLTTIGGVLRIEGNDALTSMAGLSLVETITGRLIIDQNDSLGSVTSMAALTTVSGNFSVSDNVVLPTCDVTAFVNGLMIVGTVTTTGNNDAGVCN